MDPDAFTAGLFRWDTRGASAVPPPPTRLFDPPSIVLSPLPAPPVTAAAPPPPPHQVSTMGAGAYSVGVRQRDQVGVGGLEELFQAYGIRYYTAAKIGEMGFTPSTLLDMREEELDDMMTSLSHIFRWDLLVGERYGIKAAVRAERRRLLAAVDPTTNNHPNHNNINNNIVALDALSQEGLSEEPVQQGREAAGSGGGGVVVGGGGERMRMQRQMKQQGGSRSNSNYHDCQRRRRNASSYEDEDEEEEADDDDKEGEEDDDDDIIINNNNHNMNGGGRGGSMHVRGMISMRMMREHGNSISSGGGGKRDENQEDEHEYQRQREHPFIVTEPGEVARGKKNGLDYLFHLYEECRRFLIQVQTISKQRGEKSPSKVTNQVFRYAKEAGASYINKPKMRHYVHCYALHCLDEDASNALRRSFKERGENVGAWRQACYKPLVSIAARQARWDIDSIFESHPRLSIWYVPTKLRQLCHAERSAATATASATASNTHHHLPF
ncbi:protein ALF [Malania oleifera]|uniref:protein ALF n=1 Tax=Malania oleifera TaxID=397392 RepID=UPI0025AE221E|nr:protein ALF [Malania oleifera]